MQKQFGRAGKEGKNCPPDPGLFLVADPAPRRTSSLFAVCDVSCFELDASISVGEFDWVNDRLCGAPLGD